jgi:hypothetical protein
LLEVVDQEFWEVLQSIDDPGSSCGIFFLGLYHSLHDLTFEEILEDFASEEASIADFGYQVCVMLKSSLILFSLK